LNEKVRPYSVSVHCHTVIHGKVISTKAKLKFFECLWQ